MAWTFKGWNWNKLLPGLIVNLKGFSGRRKLVGMVTEVDFSVSKYQPKNPIDLGKLFPAGRGGFLSGELEISGRFTMATQETKCSLRIKLRDGKYEMAEKELLVEGIDRKSVV